MLLIRVFNPSLESRGDGFLLYNFMLAYLICHGDADLARCGCGGLLCPKQIDL